MRIERKKNAVTERQRHFENSDELCQYMNKQFGDTVILSFSAGKDSIGSWLQLKRYFKKITPVYTYLIPNLDFIEKSLDYYEDYFQTNIYRVPNPNLYKMLADGVFQTKERMDNARGMRIPSFDRTDLFNCIREDYIDGDMNVPAAVGIRAADNLQRWTTCHVHGVVNYKKKQFFPIFDWNQKKLIEEIENEGVKLPNDYNIWGCSFDGLHYKFLKGVKENYPNDYEKIKEWFPLIDVELLKYKFRGEYVQAK